MAMLTKKDILDKQDLKTKTVHVAEWGGDVIISTMTGFARDRFEASILDKSGAMDGTNVRAKLVAGCLVDEKGELLFSAEDIIRLGKKSCAPLDKLFAEARELNGMGDEKVDELAKN